jgi:hypothetical protein
MIVFAKNGATKVSTHFKLFTLLAKREIIYITGRSDGLCTQTKTFFRISKLILSKM